MDADEVHSKGVAGATDGVAATGRRVVVADDHDLVRMGLGLLLRAVDPHIVVDEAADGGRLTALLDDGTPRFMLLVDLDMPGFEGEAGVVRILAAFPDLPVVVISGAGDPGIMRRLLEAGVRGFLPKSTEGPLMRKAIELVMAGGRFVPPDALVAEVVRPDPSAPANVLSSPLPLTPISTRRPPWGKTAFPNIPRSLPQTNGSPSTSTTNASMPGRAIAC